jgi:hypothetical protein
VHYEKKGKDVLYIWLKTIGVMTAFKSNLKSQDMIKS